MKNQVLSWSQWLVESGTDDWTDWGELFGTQYVNPKLDPDEFSDREARALFRDREAEVQARRDIRQANPLQKRIRPKTDILDREKPAQWLKTQTTITIKAMENLLKGLETATGEERDAIYLEIDRLSGKLLDLKSQETRLKSADPGVRRARI